MGHGQHRRIVVFELVEVLELRREPEAEGTLRSSGGRCEAVMYEVVGVLRMRTLARGGLS